MFKIVFYLNLSLYCFLSWSQINAYIKPSYIDQETWISVSPYFLPEKHPMKSQLDAIFKASRVSSTSSTLKKAGFNTPEARPISKAVVSKHPKLKGYLVKLYLDETPDIKDAEKWLLRIKGAQIAQNLIDKHGCHHYFKVPKKWIYPLPENPSSLINHQRKHFILLVENLNPLKSKENKECYLNEMSYDLLQNIQKIIEQGGLDDSIVVANLPFCKDGRLAFLDTEVFNRWPIRYHLLAKHLSKKMKTRLRQLVKKQTP